MSGDFLKTQIIHLATTVPDYSTWGFSLFVANYSRNIPFFLHWRPGCRHIATLCSLNIPNNSLYNASYYMCRKITSHWQPLFSKKMAAAASFFYKISGGGKDLTTLLAAVLTSSGYWWVPLQQAWKIYYLKNELKSEAIQSM